jgi:putative sigma-54 modulation protein
MVTGRHIDVTDAMKNYAREKLGRIMHERPHINEVHVIMDVEKYRHRVEVSVRGKNLDLFCREETADMYASIDRVLQKLERQLRRYKERHLKKHQTPPTRIATPEEVPAPRREPYLSERVTMNPMYVTEALLQMKVERHLFFIFLDAETEQVNFLYRMGDGEIGHLEPRKIKGPDQQAKFRLRVFREDDIHADMRLRPSRTETCYVGWATPEGALAAMVAAGEKYRFFMNTAARNACVVYARAGGSYALIEPQS